MIEIIRKIVMSVLYTLYEQVGFAFIGTVLCMFLYLYAKEFGWKTIIKHWLKTFKEDINFRKKCFLVFYTAMIILKTLLNRAIWANPLGNVIGVWGLYNADGEMTTEVLENLALFLPFTILLLWNYREKILGCSVGMLRSLWKSAISVFLFSLTIEALQLFFRLGTFQLSDLFYNTLGGLVGGFIYWCGYKLTHRKKKEKDITDTP